MLDPAVELIKYAYSKPYDCHLILELWLHGEFEILRKEFNDIPQVCFLGCDPQHPLSTADPIQPCKNSKTS